MARVPYPPLSRHLLIGDRRTSALTAADGTVNWLCAPRGDSPPLLGALLDHEKGGSFRLGPTAAAYGEQSYEPDTTVAGCSWTLGASRLRARDAMAWPESERPAGLEGRGALLRTLSCAGAPAEIELTLAAADDFSPAPMRRMPGGAWTSARGLRVELWTSLTVSVERGRLHARAVLRPGQTAWAVLTWGPGPSRPWTRAAVDAALEAAVEDWRRFAGTLRYEGPRRERVRRSLLTMRLLDFAPAGSLFAAPTTSLPEKIGGSWNADYRFAWVRDSSLAMQVLSLIGETREAGRYLRWLADRRSRFGMPLDVLYRVDGGPLAPQRDQHGVAGYRGSAPVRLGNHAYKQRQIDALGALADCALTFHQQGGDLAPEEWSLIRAAARYTARAWSRPGNGMWELSRRERWVSSLVMSWVCLDRAQELARRLGGDPEAAAWAVEKERIKSVVQSRGWSEKLGAFRQRLDQDTLDASALLIPVMGFLPPGDRRARATVDAVARRLSINGFVYRFDPASTPGIETGVLGDFEGAFLPCTLWLATAYARQGRRRDAEAVLDAVDEAAGPSGLLAEAVDARGGGLLGNYPLAFSHVEYVRAALALAGRSGPRHRGVTGS